MYSVYQHVEGHTAALMRQPDGPRQVTLVVSAEPCQGPGSCEERLPAILPAGATLAVFVAHPDGKVAWWRTYSGTGEGMTR